MILHIKQKIVWLTLFIMWVTPHAMADTTHVVEAAKSQDWDTVHTYVKGDVDINVAEADGTTTLAWAVYWDNVEIVKLLVGANADTNVSNDYGVTPLVIAIRNRNPEIVKLLLSGGAEPNLAMWSGETPLMTAAITGVVEIVNLLLDHGANINSREYRRGQTALMWAIAFGQPEVARIFIEQGASINVKTTMLKEDGFTSMILEGYTKNVDVTPKGGYTPLMFAARIGDIATTKLLIDRGVEINDTHLEEGTALVIASAGGHEDLAILLLDRGADPNLSDINGITPLHYTMREGLKTLHNLTTVSSDNYWILPGNNMHRLANALIKHGADVNAHMKSPPAQLRLRPSSISHFHMKGATPFFLAAASADMTGMELLLEADADPKLGTDIDKKTFNQQIQIHDAYNQVMGNAKPLMVASGLGRRKSFSALEEKRAIEATQTLLELGSDINEATATGWTSLHAAAYLGANDLVNYLVDNGARVNAINGCGRSPLSLAEGKSTLGLQDRPVPRQATLALLRRLGGRDVSTSEPVGACVLGRGGLEAEIEIQNQIDSVNNE